MRIAVLGTGSVGRALAGGFARTGHDVTVGTRDVAVTMARSTPDAMGNAPFAAWLEATAGVAVQSLAEAAASAEVVVNATSGAASLDALEAAGEDNLEGKVLLDVANPLDASGGMPPVLAVSNTDSLAERIQRRFPTALVVKALNTMNAAVMVDPALVGGGDHTVFLCGDDDAAKGVVRELLGSFGWTDILDLGDITTARGPEMLLPLWLRTFSALGTSLIQFKVVR